MFRIIASSGIGQRIGRLVAVAVFTGVLVAALTLAVIQVGKDIEAARRNLENTSYALAATVADAVEAKDRKLAFESLRAMSRMPEVKVVVLNDASGQTLASLGQTTILSDDLATMESGKLSLLASGTMPVAVDIIRGGTIIGKLILIADISRVRQDFMVTVITTLIAAFAAAALGMLISRPVQRQIVTPVTDLTSQIAAIKKSRNYSSSLAVQKEIGEVGTLIDSFNALMSDIRFRDTSLRNLAYFDPLTGLPNQASILNALTEKRDTLSNATLAVFEIHRFPSFNNAFGQTIGDAILLSVAATLRDTADGSMVARTGAYEYAVLFENSDGRYGAEQQVAQVLAAFIQPMTISKSEIKIDINCGALLIGAVNDDWKDGRDLLRFASLALHDAKELGPNRAVFYRPEMNFKALTESELGQELRIAIAQGKLEAHYQPQIDARTGAITGFEALARWNHPNRGMVPPGQFVPIAESNGLITELGDWVLNEGCKQAADWLRVTGEQRVVSVNVSAAQFLESRFAEKVMATARRHGLPAHLMCLEVTESIFIGAGMAEIRNTLQALSDAGFLLALDDFGTGYSSLGYLAQLPFNTIKIDRSFVRDAHTSERRTAILRSIIGMSHSIGLEVVAEGAETPAEIELLQELNVDKIQGFGIARPMPARRALEFAAGYAPQPRRAAG